MHMGMTSIERQEAVWRGILGRLTVQTPDDQIAGVRGQSARLHDIPNDFEGFFRSYEPRITGYLWRMVGDDGAACDLCQETFIRAWQHFAEVQAAHQPIAWLYRVATNLALNHVRARSRGIRAAVPLTDATAP